MQQYLRAIDNTEPSQVIRKVSGDRVSGFFFFLTVVAVPGYPTYSQLD